VRRVQRRLISLKYTDHAADGIFDGKTATALKLFQRASDLAETAMPTGPRSRHVFAEAVANDHRSTNIF
jgi:peptidoglycan hydrolase-like protein with peptidoglycan-binding domain